ncbi:MAG TPA: bifunctional methylenetetrahydrofolate dehydrogenase/methenyltetrahydrofolate cyclohydrolase FolD [Bacteroidia bacterium]|jgi:methylenetetrahydrofolate dehydrogenase (NADP+)/methenyltetrahydrofolate cyclohydrolase|nr:bifunctional methylenetetrahydrofolate dehydrogenase/methenyltetrahydrofolate cyclohydrolase FolD [Bacteroidia bacterium]
MPIIINGKEVSEKIQQEIAAEVEQIKKAGKRVPHLAAVLVGNDPASQTYVNSKIKTCEKVGFKSSLVRFDENISEKELLTKITELNNDDDLDGYIVQLPLPKHIAEQKVIEAVKPGKDVDGFHPVNVGRLVLNLPTYISATPYGIVQLLEHYKIETQGKHCVVIGRSNIVGTPMSILMAKNNLHANCTVTLCHSKTKNLKEHTLQADIIIAAIGRPDFVTADMVKQNAVVIDVGINRIPSTQTKSGFKLVGDVKFDEVAPKCSYITPVPGGVGPMTIASLLKNTLFAAKKEIYK